MDRKIKQFFIGVVVILFTIKIYGQAYKIGDLYTFPDGSKGVVCYVDPNNPQKGWAAALNDLEGKYTIAPVVTTPSSSSPGYVYVSFSLPDGLKSKNYSNKYENVGKYNTRILLESGTSPAAEAVDFYNGWYIPDKNQLAVMHRLIPIINDKVISYGGDITNLAKLMGDYGYYSSEPYSYDGRKYVYCLRNLTNNFGITSTEYNIIYDPSNVDAATHKRIRPVRDFGDEAYAYWVDKPKSASMVVQPAATRKYDALVIYGKDTFNVKTQAYVKGICNADFYDTICPIKTTYTWLDTTFLPGTVSGIYERQGKMDVGGVMVDTAAVLHLVVWEDFKAYDTVSFCPGSSSITYSKNSNVTISETTVTSSSPDVVVSNGTGAGNYLLTMKTIHDCDSIIYLHVDMWTIPNDTLKADTVYLDEVVGGTVVSNGYTFTNITAVGTYYVTDTLTAANGCDSIITIVVIVEEGCKLTLTLASNTDEMCGGDGAIIVSSSDGAAPVKYSIDNGATWSTDPVFKNLSASTYTIQAKDANNCEATVSATVAPAAIPTITVTCPPDVYDTLMYGDCVMNIYSDKIGTPTYVHSFDWPMAISNNIPEDFLFQDGETIITWVFADKCGNSESCEQKITVVFPQCPDAVDCEGNVYKGVRIGCDCWTQRNLESTQYSAGGTCVGDIPCAYEYESDRYPDAVANVATFGRLYCFEAAIGDSSDNGYGHIQGICPEGWYLPTPEKYSALYALGASALKSPNYWVDGGGSNSTEFTWLPAGRWNGEANRFEGLMSEGYFWATENTGGNVTAKTILVRYECDETTITETSTGNGYSVRCIKEKGNSNPTNTSCAPADAQPCPGTYTVLDHEGNKYNTVQIGNQCWTKENMRCKTSPNGYLTEGGMNTSVLKPYYYDKNNSSTIPFEEMGLFYNWAGAVDAIFTSDQQVAFANRRGICPEGWHVPSDDEWTVLENYLKNSDCYACGDDENQIAKALASDKYWDSDNGNCTVGEDISSNNTTGFSLLPFGHYMWVWSSTSSETNKAYDRSIGKSYSVVNRNSQNKGNNTSVVRCLRDNKQIVTLPVVTTMAVACDGETGGNVIDDGGAQVTARGVVWSTTPNPTLNNNKTQNGMGMGSYTSSINMTKGVKYYVRAYATNSEGTSYGNQFLYVNYDSLPCPATPTVTDHEGNVYNTVQIGDQCWTRENMRCTTSPKGNLHTMRYWAEYYNNNLCTYDYPEGVSTALNCVSLSPVVYKCVPGNDTTLSFGGIQYSFDNSDYDNDTIYNIEGRTLTLRQVGYRYNWCGAMDTILSDLTEFHDINFTNRRGICPEGWHVPSFNDWQILEDYINSYPCYLCDNTVGNNVKAMVSKEYWEYPVYDEWSDCLPGKDTSTNNKLGFNAIPVYRYGLDEFKFGSTGFWQSNITENGFCTGPDFGNYYPWDVSIYHGGSYMNYGNPVRCLRDEIGNDNTGSSTEAELPTVITNSVGCYGVDDAVVESRVENDGGSSIIARGVVWSTNHNPTISDNYTVDAYGKGDYLSIIKGLVQGTTYYVRAYATNAVGIAYGEEVGYTNAYESVQSCPGTPTVSDHENNVYNTVLIGTQCWTKENMRCKTSPKGYLQQGSSSGGGSLNPCWYENNEDTIPTQISGLYYNWVGALDTMLTSRDTISFENRRGICPQGWHIPSEEEWKILEDYVSEQKSPCVCDNNNAKALASDKYWYTSVSNSLCDVGDEVNSNNITGFSAIPVGYFNGGSTAKKFDNSGYTAYFVSSTSVNDNTKRVRSISYGSTNVSNGHTRYNDYYGYSVRCLKDN